jgi:hypothetical protein
MIIRNSSTFSSYEVLWPFKVCSQPWPMLKKITILSPSLVYKTAVKAPSLTTYLEPIFKSFKKILAKELPLEFGLL